jgi:hypothetical protein
VEFNEEFFRQLGRSAGVVGVVMEATERVAGIARADAPVDSGQYRAGIDTKLKFQDRAVGLVVSSDPKTMILEAKHGVLVRAVKKAGRRG